MAKILDVNSEEYKLGQRIQKIRKQKNMTQNDLADIMDMDRANIANYENGTKGEMGFKTLLKFSKALGVTTDYLLGEDEGNAEITKKIFLLNEENTSVVMKITDSLILQQQFTA